MMLCMLIHILFLHSRVGSDVILKLVSRKKWYGDTLFSILIIPDGTQYLYPDKSSFVLE